MANREKLARFGTQDTGRRQKKKQNKKTQNRKITKRSNTDPTKTGGEPCASYKTPTVLLIYTVKSGKSLGSDRGKKTSR